MLPRHARYKKHQSKSCNRSAQFWCMHIFVRSIEPLLGYSGERFDGWERRLLSRNMRASSDAGAVP